MGSAPEAVSCSPKPLRKLFVDGDFPSVMRDAVATDDSSDGRRASCRELDDDSDGAWNRMVSKPGFFFFLPSQLSLML